MPTVEKTDGGPVYLRALERELAIGDRVGVNEQMADYLCEERGDFDRVDGVTDVEYTETADSSSDGDGGENFEINGWLENDYEDRADAVLEGGLDDYLDEIEEAESSETVIDAVQERRAELQED